MAIQSFQIHKRSSYEFKFIQDKVAISEKNNVVAISDGTTQSFWSDKWAEILTESFVENPTFEKDKFANIDKRLMTDAGAKYIALDTERTKFFSELGYRYMHEERLDDTKAFSNYGRAYTEWEHKWNPNSL